MVSNLQERCQFFQGLEPMRWGVSEINSLTCQAVVSTQPCCRPQFGIKTHEELTNISIAGVCSFARQFAELELETCSPKYLNSLKLYNLGRFAPMTTDQVDNSLPD